jgi:hypothetical protein
MPQAPHASFLVKDTKETIYTVTIDRMPSCSCAFDSNQQVRNNKI